MGGGGGSSPDMGPAIASVKEFGGKAIDSQLAFNNMAGDILQPEAATNAATIQSYLDQANASTRPIRDMGFDAMDQYADGIGLSRPTAGSKAMSYAMENAAKLEQAKKMQQMAAQQAVSKLNVGPDEAYRLNQGLSNATNPTGAYRMLSDYMNNNPTSMRGTQMPSDPNNARPGYAGGGGMQGINSSLMNMLNAAQATKTAQYGMSPQAQGLAQLAQSGYANKLGG